MTVKLSAAPEILLPAGAVEFAMEAMRVASIRLDMAFCLSDSDRLDKAYSEARDQLRKAMAYIDDANEAERRAAAKEGE